MWFSKWYLTIHLIQSMGQSIVLINQGIEIHGSIYLDIIKYLESKPYILFHIVFMIIYLVGKTLFRCKKFSTPYERNVSNIGTTSHFIGSVFPIRRYISSSNRHRLSGDRLSTPSLSSKLSIGNPGWYVQRIGDESSCQCEGTCLDDAACTECIECIGYIDISYLILTCLI